MVHQRKQSRMTKTIPLSQGKVALVDDADYGYLSQFKWSASKDYETWYAVRHTPKVEGKKRKILMHREILDVAAGIQVDHKDRDGLNNTRSNLRYATNTENGQNRRKQRGGSSRFKGVYWRKDREKWHATIRVNGKNKHLGHYDNEVDAARAYDDAARQYFGEFACPNFP